LPPLSPLKPDHRRASPLKKKKSEKRSVVFTTTERASYQHES
jgi:hypothetical protein